MGELSYEQLLAYIQGLYDEGGLSEEDYNRIILYILSNGILENSPRDLIQIRRGSESKLPNLAQGELGFTLDEENLFIGGVNGNVNLTATNRYNVKKFGVIGDGITDDTQAIQSAIDFVNSAGGGQLLFPQGEYLATRLTIRSFVNLVGEGKGITFLRCTDNGAGSFFKKLDDGERVFYFGIQSMSIVTALSSVATSESVFQNVIGVNLCACERGLYSDLQISGFGNGALVLARAEGGAEGLGFVNTTQDGNYNIFNGIYVDSCGNFNSSQASIWLKYKANSNKFYGVYGKPAAKLIVIERGNDNLFCGGASETAISIAYLGENANGNNFISFRGEGLTGDAYLFAENSGSLYENVVIGGYLTGVGGQEFNQISKRNKILSGRFNHFRNYQFPPLSNVSQLHNYGMLNITGVNGDNNYPLYVKSETYNDGSTPKIVGYDTNLNRNAGDNVFEIAAYNSDSSTNAKGENAKIKAKVLDTVGKTGWSFETGSNNVTTPKVEINDHLETVGNGGWNNPHLVLGTHHFWVDSTGNLRTKNGIPTSDTDGVVVGNQTGV